MRRTSTTAAWKLAAMSATWLSVKFSIPLVVYGENINYEYGGKQRKETYSAKDQINNDVAGDIPWNNLIDDSVSVKDLSLCIYPSIEEIEHTKLDPIYLSYFMRWSSYKSYLFAKKRGFKDLTHEWKREHHIEDFDRYVCT